MFLGDEKMFIINQLEEASLRQELITFALKTRYESMSKERDIEHEKQVKELQDNFIKSESINNGLLNTIKEVRSEISKPGTTSKEYLQLLTSYERVSKECSTRYITMAKDAEELKIHVINLDQENKDIYTIIELQKTLNK